jgi:Family of unknown function (DUF5990)
METEIPLRITLIAPPPGVRFAMQSGRHDLVQPRSMTGDAIVFDFAVRVKDNRADGRPNFLGAFAQGPQDARFVYVNSGTSAGQAESCWTRRAKIPLTGITWDLIERLQAKAGAVLEAHIRGAGRDGGPACATVPLLDGGWAMTTRRPAA